MQSEVARWANEAIGNGTLMGPVGAGGRSLAAAAPTAYLPLDIRQKDGEFVVEASVPGFTPEEVEITADQGVLTIRGERRAERSDEMEGSYLRRERSHHSVVRQLTLPADVKEDEIRASFLNGVLTVTIPRAEAPAPRRIPVRSGPAAPGPAVIEAAAAPS
ncbi:MAG: Hsp20/alpha crystallin family protein [Candidatus Dormibacteria bacterium]